MKFTVLALLLVMAPADSVNLTITVQANPSSVSARPPAASNALPAILGAAAAGATTTGVLWPKGRELAKCTPNLEPRFSAWQELLEENDGRLCTTTKLPA